MSHPVRQFSFSSGEISPSLYARTDLDRYRNGLRTCRNMQVMRQGGVTGRPGTMYVGTTLNNGNPVRLIPFIFNETGLGQSYVLEFGNNYILVYQNGSVVIKNTMNIFIVTKASPGAIGLWTSTLPFTNGQLIFIDGIQGMTELNGNYYTIANISGNSFNLKDLNGNTVDTSGFSNYTGGGFINSVAIIATGYKQDDLENLNYTQSADVLTLVHPNYQVREFSRLSASVFSLSTVSNWGSNVDWPTNVVQSQTGGSGLSPTYYISSVDSEGQESDAGSTGYQSWQNVALNAASVANPINIVWDAMPGAIYYRIYVRRDNASFGFIGQVLTNSFSDIGQDPDFTNLYPQYTQFFGNDGDTNNPSTVGFSQQRRYFANTIDNPVGFWGSRPGAFSNFDVHITSEDDDAIIGSIAGEEVNAIEAITELRFMLMLTAGSEIYVQGDGSGVVKPQAVNAAVQSQYGCSTLRPIKVSDALLFNQSLGSFIRDFAFDFATDGYRGNDITIFASHLFEGYQINDWCFQKVPDSIIWAVRSDGVLLSCTYIREQEVIAWARHDFVNGFVENICSIPENGEYAVYATIRRVINGETVLYLERVSSRVWRDPINATYLDCFLEYDGNNEAVTVDQYQIIQAFNDSIDFSLPGIGQTGSAFIAPGSYTSTSLATAIAVALQLADSVHTWGCIFTGGVFDIYQTGGTTANYKFLFGTGRYKDTSAALTLGWPKTDTAISTNPGPHTFDQFAPNPPASDTVYATTMLLDVINPFIAEGVNDNIYFQDITSGTPISYLAIIEPGTYTGATLAIAVAKAMNKVSGSSTYTCTFSGGVLHIGTSATVSFVLLFNTTDPHYSTSAAFTLGFTVPRHNFVFGPGSVIATSVPQLAFSNSSYAYQQQLRLISGIDFFTSTMVGDQIFLQDALWVSSQGKKGNQVRCTIQSYVSSVEVTITPSEIVPIEFQGTFVTSWSRAVATVSGLDYLEGQVVSVWADRFVVGSPLNPQVTTKYTVSDGAITLDKQYAVIYVGLPMVQDIESLDLESYFGETMLGKRKRISRVSVYVYNTRTFFAGAENPGSNQDNTNNDPLFQLYEEKNGRNQETYDVAPDLMTRQDYVITPSRWTKNGRVFFRNVDPVPFSLLAIAPSSEDPVDTPYKT